ncbi:hypothetical protein KUCAC02_032056 [Chaenocephalus aceratus]|nr:hypothetical protein KUCAC02_032056 [Chaenocephalus aceratus]
MDVFRRLFGSFGRVRSESFSSDASQTQSSKKLVLRHRTNKLITCLDDLDPESELCEKMERTVRILSDPLHSDHVLIFGFH